MLDLKKYQGPYGIPIYHYQTPDDLKAVKIAWTVFTGGADDTDIGAPGLHHWFEHVPFRGTKKYPRGPIDIEAPFAPMSGKINAYTNMMRTCYFGTFHTSQWKEGLSVLTDLVAQPLITDEAVEAERSIIHQEIVGRNSDQNNVLYRQVMGTLYPGHPYGADVIGNEKTLTTMNAETLRVAWRRGYDRSRMILLVIGNISESDLMTQVVQGCEELPDHQISERRVHHFHGALPEWKSGTIEVATDFAASAVRMYFPLPVNTGQPECIWRSNLACILLDTILEYGGMTAPLKRILREERQLVYSADTGWDFYPGGGYYLLGARAQANNLEKICEAFHDVLKDPQLRDPLRFKDAKSAARAALEMMPNSPGTHFTEAITQICNGIVMPVAEKMRIFESLTLDDVDHAITSILDTSNARTFLFRGKH